MNRWKLRGTLKKFFTDYNVRDLLKACRAEKQKGHSVFEIFRYLLCLVFYDRSMYMQLMTGRYSEAWQEYCLPLSEFSQDQLGKAYLSAVSKNHQPIHSKADWG